MAEIIERIYPTIEEIVNKLDLYLIDAKFVYQGSDYFLEIYIDSRGGLTMGQCEQATREINKYLDEEDPIQGQYILIVSSPGLDRPLESDLDLDLALGTEVELNFYSPYQGQKKIYGTLNNFDESNYYISYDKDQERVIDRSLVSKISKAIRI